MERIRERLTTFDATLLSLDQVYTICSHVIYFQACEIVLLSGHQKATYLYTLMFYNVVSYCLNYAKEVYQRKAWTPYVTITETSQVKHLGMSATKLTLEWTKFLIFMLTAVFILLTIGFAQEVQGVRTTLTYMLSTLVFYAMTDKLFVDLFSQWSLLSKIDLFECREALYGRLVLKIGAAFLSLTMHLALLLKTKKFKLFCIGFYVNVYLRSKDLLYNELTTLAVEDESVKRFRTANKTDISKFDDVCAICLGEMKKAKATDCHHLFHDHCLSLAIQTSPSPACPTCKALL